jgi:hypothetical protein
MYRRKSSTQFWADFVLFKKLPKVDNQPDWRKFAQLGHPSSLHCKDYKALAAWSSGIVSACHRGDFSYGS